MYVELFDIENGEEYEKTIKLILWKLIDVDVELFWRTFISKAIEYGANRRCLSRENLKEQCKSFFKENQTKEELLASPFSIGRGKKTIKLFQFKLIMWLLFQRKKQWRR